MDLAAAISAYVEARLELERHYKAASPPPHVDINYRLKLSQLHCVCRMIEQQKGEPQPAPFCAFAC